MSQLVVLDNTVLTNLALVNQTDLVFRLWSNVCTTPAVMAEYQAGAASGKFATSAWSKLPLIESTEQEIEWARKLASRSVNRVWLLLTRQDLERILWKLIPWTFWFAH